MSVAYTYANSGLLKLNIPFSDGILDVLSYQIEIGSEIISSGRS